MNPIVLFDANSTSLDSQLVSVLPGQCMRLTSSGLVDPDVASLLVAQVLPGSVPLNAGGACCPDPAIDPSFLLGQAPYAPCGQPVVLTQTDNIVIVRGPAYYRMQIPLTALGQVVITAEIYECLDACAEQTAECCGGLPICDQLQQLAFGAPLQPGEFVPAIDGGLNCRLAPFDLCVHVAALPPTLPTVNTQLAGLENGACGLFTVDSVLALYPLCTNLQAFPALANPALTDQVIVLSGGGCFLSTIDDMFGPTVVCDSLQEFPLGAPSLATTLVSASPACEQINVSDLFALLLAQPLLAADGSCAAPAYSFASSPASGLFFDPGIPAVTLSWNNCASRVDVGDVVRITALNGDFFEIGASATISADGATIAISSVGAVTVTPAPTRNAIINAGVGGISELRSPSTLAIIAVNDLTGQILLNQPATGSSVSLTSTGQARVFAGAGESVLLTSNGLSFALELTATGEFSVNSNPGAVTEVLTSQGPGLPPIWSPATPVFPLLASDGSCLAPSYSFTSSPDSGIWYDSGTGEVVISDDNCADQIRVGASISLLAASGDQIVLSSGISLSTAPAAGPVNTINLLAGNNLTGANPGGYINIQSGVTPGAGPGLSYWYGGQPGGTGGGSVHSGGFGTFQGGYVELFGGAGPSNSVGGTVRAVGSVSGGGDILLAMGADVFHTVIGDLVVRARDSGTEFGEYLRIVGLGGEWRLATNPGAAGEVITSQGAGLPPIWSAPTPSFPLLAPDGSCLAPSYSFTSSPDSGIFYDPAGVGSVVIGDDNCADFIAVGASITLQTATSNVSVSAGANVSVVAGTNIVGSGGTISMLGGLSGGGPGDAGGSITFTGGDKAAAGPSNAGSVTSIGGAAVRGTGATIAAGGGFGTGFSASFGGGQAFVLGGNSLDPASHGGPALVRGGRAALGARGGFIQATPGTTANTGGDVFIASGIESLGGSAPGDIIFATGVFDAPAISAAPSAGQRLRIIGIGGEWQLAGDPGIAGQALTSGGPGAPPTWVTASASVTLDQVQDATASAVRNHGVNVIDWQFDAGNTNALILRDANDERFRLGPFSFLTGRRSDGEASLIALSSTGTTQAFARVQSHPTQPNVFLSAVLLGTGSTIDVRTTGVHLVSNGTNGILHESDRHTFRSTTGQGKLMLGTYSALFASGNLLRIDGTANGGTPVLAAEGASDANVSIQLTPKGTGTVLTPSMTITTNAGLALTSQVDGAGASLGTLTNAPSAGDPVFWLPVSINGTTRFVPAWA